MRALRPKKPVPIEIPPWMRDVDAWLVVGLDPSLSRTGYALSLIKQDSEPTKTAIEWLAVGSVKPDSAANPIWVRGKAMALYLQQVIGKWADNAICPLHFSDAGGAPLLKKRVGLLVSLEFPTPMNDFLVALNRIIHLVFFEGDFHKRFAAVRVLSTNAATLRSLMGLTMRGAKNKKENILRAYSFVDRATWPSLDTDSCDAVLLSIMGHYAATIMLGLGDNVPGRFMTSLCNATKEAKGKGTRMRIITKGLLHRPEYFYPYERKNYTLLIKDAANPKPGLRREHFEL